MPLWRTDPPDGHSMLAFSTRQGGVSPPPFDTLNVGRSTADRAEAVTENRRRVIAALGLDSDRLVTAGQVHGSSVAEAVSPGHLTGCDALVTRTPGLALAVTTADCMALLFVAPRAVAAAHSGWRGTVAGIPVATLRAVCEASGAQPGEVSVHVGPCIRGCCYEVGSEVAGLFPAESLHPGETRVRLDLPVAAAIQLRAAGVTRIFDTGACTACEPHWYYSHRRDRGACGRHWAIVARFEAKTSEGL